MERLDGKRIIVTGGTSGMGEGIVRAFPALGAKVVFWGRNEKAGAKIASESGATFVKAEITDPVSVTEGMKILSTPCFARARRCPCTSFAGKQTVSEVTACRPSS